LTHDSLSICAEASGANETHRTTLTERFQIRMDGQMQKHIPSIKDALSIPSSHSEVGGEGTHSCLSGSIRGGN